LKSKISESLPGKSKKISGGGVYEKKIQERDRRPGSLKKTARTITVRKEIKSRHIMVRKKKLVKEHLHSNFRTKHQIGEAEGVGD